MEKKTKREQAKRFVIIYLLSLIAIQAIGILILINQKDLTLFFMGAILIGSILPIILGLIMLRIYKLD
ncbi:MAG: hypothetical protein Q6351_001260 [Candidatus Njordarchaeum guaymaensis]